MGIGLRPLFILFVPSFNLSIHSENPRLFGTYFENPPQWQSHWAKMVTLPASPGFRLQATLLPLSLISEAQWPDSLGIREAGPPLNRVLTYKPTAKLRMFMSGWMKKNNCLSTHVIAFEKLCVHLSFWQGVLHVLFLDSELSADIGFSLCEWWTDCH